MHKIKLEDFGLKRRADGSLADKLDTTSILSILVAFNIPLFTEAFKNWRDLTLLASYFFGALTLIFYMLYLTDYYEKIWTKWFSLPSDLGFFRVYSLVSGVIVISVMTVFPHFWYWYLTVLITILTCKKYSTRWAYIEAFKIKYGSVPECKNKVDRAILALAENMSTNFFRFGVCLSVVASACLSAGFYLDKTIGFSVFGTQIQCKPYYTFAMGLWSVNLVLFWFKKIRKGLNFIVVQVEEGNYEFFEQENR